MNPLSLLFRRRARADEEVLAAHCGACAFFNNDPRFLEASMPGLASLSSADGSVRSDDGICVIHDRYLGPECHCARFQTAVRSPADS